MAVQQQAHRESSVLRALVGATYLLQKQSEKAPSFMAGMNRPLCLTNICSSEYAVFSCVLLCSPVFSCCGRQGGDRCPTSRRPPSASCGSWPCGVSPPPHWLSAKRCA